MGISIDSDGLLVTEQERKGLKKVFLNFGKKKTEEEIFYNLCFCICAPQTKFHSNRTVNEELHKIDFYSKNISEDKLQKIVKPVRYYRNKSKWLLEMKSKFDFKIMSIVDSLEYMEEIDVRDKLVKEVKGLGWKTASHFLRNLGCQELAIIDTHILKFLGKEREGFFGRKKYLEYELMFNNIARINRLSVAELDALIWKRYSDTDWSAFLY